MAISACSGKFLFNKTQLHAKNGVKFKCVICTGEVKARSCLFCVCLGTAIVAPSGEEPYDQHDCQHGSRNKFIHWVTCNKMRKECSSHHNQKHDRDAILQTHPPLPHYHQTGASQLQGTYCSSVDAWSHRKW